MTNECSECGAICGYAADPRCSVCHGYGAPTPRQPVVVESSADDAKYAHDVYDAVRGLRNAPEDVQARARKTFDDGVAEIMRKEDDEWMRQAGEILGFESPGVLVREIDHSSVYSAVDGRILLTKQTDPKRNGVYIGGAKVLGHDTIAVAKLAEPKRYASFRSRVGNAVPASKLKQQNRKKAKAAKAARKAQR